MPLAKKDSRGDDVAEQAYLIECLSRVSNAEFDETEGLGRLDIASDEMAAQGAKDLFRSKTRDVTERLNGLP